MSIAPTSALVSVVMITRNRRDSALHAVSRLLALPAPPPVIVVDNASADGTAAALRHAHPEIDVVRLEENLGAAARTVGVRHATTPYVAFSDDDSWWDPGALEQAARVLDMTPSLAVVAGRILVGPDGRLDPVCVEMAASPLGEVVGAGPRVLGFVACGSVVRRSAYLEVGGFHPRYGVGGEEGLLAIDLAEHGWSCAYVDRVVARHHPSAQRSPEGRRARDVRNDLWTLWLRHRLRSALVGTVRRLAGWPREPAVRTGLRQAAGGWRWVRSERMPVTARTERQLRRLARPQ